MRSRGGVELTRFARKLYAITERMFEAENEALELSGRAPGGWRRAASRSAPMPRPMSCR